MKKTTAEYTFVTNDQAFIICKQSSVANQWRISAGGYIFLDYFSTDLLLLQRRQEIWHLRSSMNCAVIHQHCFTLPCCLDSRRSQCQHMLSEHFSYRTFKGSQAESNICWKMEHLLSVFHGLVDPHTMTMPGVHRLRHKEARKGGGHFQWLRPHRPKTWHTKDEHIGELEEQWHLMNVTMKIDDFVANNTNKKKFIYMLSRHLQMKNCQTYNVPGDVDLIIVQKAVESAATTNTVLIRNDTDLLKLLIHHASIESHDLFFKPEPKTMSRNSGIGFIFEELCYYIICTVTLRQPGPRFGPVSDVIENKLLIGLCMCKGETLVAVSHLGSGLYSSKRDIAGNFVYNGCGRMK